MIGFGGADLANQAARCFTTDSTATDWMSSRTPGIAGLAAMRSTLGREAAAVGRLHRPGGGISGHRRRGARPTGRDHRWRCVP
jgi:hypothetical protein